MLSFWTKFSNNVRSTGKKNNLQRVVYVTRNFYSKETYVLRSSSKDISVPNEPLWYYVFEKTYRWPNKTAIECAETGRKLTYDQLRRRIGHFNRFLRKRLNLKQGDVVGLMLPNTPEYPIGLLGTMQAGLIPTTINPLYTEDEVFRQLKQTSVSAIVTLDTFVPLVKQVCHNIAKDIKILAVNQSKNILDSSVIDFHQAVASDCDIEDFRFKNINDLACYLYSSGTTGMPKAVELTMGNLVSGALQCTSPDFKFIEDTTQDHQDVIPAILPFYHIYGVISLMWMLNAGARILTIPKFTPELYLDTIKRYKADVLLTVPPIVNLLTKSPMVTSNDLQSVRAIMSGAAPLGALDEAKFLEKALPNKPVFLQGYGLSETGVISMSCNKKSKSPGSAGELVPSTKVKIITFEKSSQQTETEEEGKKIEVTLGPNASGELYVKGPQVFKGYLNNFQANENAFSRNWFKTGDIAYYDEDGCLYITERMKDLIKVNAFPVAPAELEEILRSHLDVADAAVIGIPNAKFGEVPRAYVVAKENKKLDEESLHKFVEEKVAPYKHIKGGIVQVDEIPKTASGKILKKDLKAEYLRKNAS